MTLKQLHLQCFSLLLLLTLLLTTTLAQSPASSPAQSPPAPIAPVQSPPAPIAPVQSPPAPIAPAQSLPAPSALSPFPPGPTNLTAILEKAGRFSILIRLLKSTQIGDRIYAQLNTTNQGLTILAPPDAAFSKLPSGFLNTLADPQKSELVQFHMLPTYVPLSQFQTLSNPVTTQAGDSHIGHFPLNLITSGNSVNITTGEVNATVGSTVYTDGQLAVYQVDKVLLPQKFFFSPAPAQPPSVHKKKKPHSNAPSSPTVDSSTAVSHTRFTHFSGMSFAVVVIAAIAL